MDNAIEVTHLGKRYRRRGMGAQTLFGRMSSLFRPVPGEEFWAVRDINFKVPRGQTVGVVGPNGSGKSSLLGLVAGTITPTEGGVTTQGRISSLLELGAGFHPDLSGRENVLLNAAILGIPREDIVRRMDHIVEFAGLQEFIDMPVKHYSSGMYVRLGFAVAVEVNPDILLVDEVLAVGDLAFQMKCFDRIRDFQKRGRTLLLVTHDLGAVEQFCHDVKLVYQGKLLAEGNPSDVILTYMKQYMMRIGHLNVEEHGTREIEFKDVVLHDGKGGDSGTFQTGAEMHIDIGYVAKRRVENPVFGFSIKTAGGFFIFGTNTQIMNHPIPFVEGEGRVRIAIKPLTLMEGKYFLSLAVHNWDHTVQYHRREDWHPFAVKNQTSAHGMFQLPCAWEHQAGT